MEGVTMIPPAGQAPTVNVIEERESTGKKFAEFLCAIFLPFLAVMIKDDLSCNKHTLINILLCFLGFWICGIIHAFWYCFFRTA